MPEYNVVSKGEYLHPQENNSIPVDSFLFIRENGKKYLLLRFDNTRKSVLTGLKLDIVQLTAKGRELGEKSIKYGNLTGKPKKLYTLTHKIEVDENCEDVKVNVTEALYGSYAYSISGGEEKVEYVAPSKKFDIDNAVNEMRWENVSVSERTVKKRIFLGIFSCLFVVLVLVFTFLQLKKFEDGRTTFHYYGVEYAFEDGDTSYGTDIYVVGFGARRSDITIPSEIEGHTVTKVSKNSFKDNTRIKTLTVESDIDIEDGAFAGCTNLKTLNIENVKNIGNNAFYGCKNLSSVTAVNLETVGESAFENCTSLASVDISHNTKKVTFGKKAFGGCTGLSSVNIAQTIVYPDDYSLFRGSDNVTELKLKNFENIVDGASPRTLVSLFGTTADYGNKLKLETVVIDNLEVIGDDFLSGAPVVNFKAGNLLGVTVGNAAFDGTRLETIDLPVSVTEVGDYAFRNTNLKEFDESELTRAGNYAFYGSALQSFDGCTLVNIGDYAFSACPLLETFKFGDGLSFMGEGAFSDCVSLLKVDYPRSLSYVADSAFSGCSGLRNLSFADSSIAYIGKNAFASCRSLTELTLPQTLVELGTGAFENCTRLEELNLPASGKFAKIGEAAFSGCVALAEAVVPYCVEEIGSGAFSNTSIEKLTVPFIGGSVDDHTFLGYIFGADRHTNVSVFPESLKSVTLTLSDSIPENGLYGCGSLEEINFPDDLVSIGAGAFGNCKSLKTVVVPDSVTNIGKGAFYGCENLTEYKAPFVGGSLMQNAFFGYVFGANSFGDAGGYVPASLESVVLTKTVALPDNAFGNCYYIKKIDLTPSSELVSLGENAFYNCLYLKQINLPQSVTAIGYRAFNNCIRLSEFIVPEGVETFGTEVFMQCYKLYEIWNLSSIDNAVIYNSAPNCLKVYNTLGDKLEKLYVNGFVIARSEGLFYLISYPEGATELSLPSTDFGYIISNHLFYADETLQNVTLPKCVSDAGVSTFANCMALKTVTFADDSIERIGAEMFRGCVNLSEVKIPAGVLAVENNAFDGCSLLTLAELPSSVTEIQSYAFGNCPALKNIVLSENLEAIGTNAFAYCESLTEIVLGEKLETLGAGAFSYCTSLKTVTLGENLEAVSAGTFFNCTSLYEINLGEKLLIIGSDAFENCTSLSVVSFPASLRKIEDYAFRGCTSLTEATLNDGLENIGAMAFEGCTSLTGITIPSTVTSLGYRAFAGCTSLISAEIQNGLQAVPQEAFTNCTSLEQVSLGNVTDIGANAFTGAAIKYLELPEGLTNITYLAFSNNLQLRSVSVPSSLTRYGIGTNAFANCPKLYLIYNLGSLPIAAGSTDYGSLALNALVVASSYEQAEYADDNSVTYLRYLDYWRAVWCADDATEINLQAFTDNGGNTVTSFDILPRAFANNSNLTNAVIGSAVNALGEGAFERCASLKTVKFESGLLKAVTGNSFAYCNALESVAVDNANITAVEDYAFIGCNSLTSLNLCEGLESIGGSAFADCYGLKKVSFPATLKSIGDSAFMNCGGLTEVTFPSAESIGDSAFINCSNLSNVSFPETLQSIGNSAFQGCGAMTEVNLPLSLTSVGSYAFAYCYNVKDVTLSAQLTVIPDGMFANNGRLKSVKIPENVISVGSSAFESCSSLEEVILPASLETIGYNAFYNCSGITSLILPENLRQIDYQAFFGCSELLVLYNLSGLTISFHDDTNGMVGYYAVAVFDSLDKKAYFTTVNDCRFVLLEDGWHAFRYSGAMYETIYLPESFEYGGATVTQYYINDYFFESISSIVIPKAVKQIEPYAFNYGNTVYTTVYYGGTAEEWNAVKAPNFRYCEPYYYVDCVHRDYEWTYDANGKVSVVKSVYEFVSVERQEATCTEHGYEIFKCSHCDYTYTNTLWATGHSPVTDEYKAPTCTEEGLTEGSHCGVCGEVLIAQEVIPATGHTEVIDEGREPTCTEEGLTEGSHCGVCGEVLIAQEAIPATGHTEVIDEGREPTCTEEGLTEGSHCGVCGEVLKQQEVIPATGHKFDENGTCTECGAEESGKENAEEQ